MASSSSSSPEIPAPLSNHNHNHNNHNNHRTPTLQQKLHECLEDLSSRFILNLPEVELASLERVCFQVEQAHWYYEDFIREEDPSLPTMTLKKFSHSLFNVCPLLKHFGHDHDQAFSNFLAYKTRVPVCGAIMLNETWDKCLLVKGWKSTSAWSFPKGKINEQEPRYKCAIREVLEETGFDLEDHINPEDVAECNINEQSISLFIVPNIPEDFPFETRTRKEISKIAWFKLTDLPTWKRNKPVTGKFYLIAPFLGPLKIYLRDRKPKQPKLSKNGPSNSQAASDADSPDTVHSLPAPSLPASSAPSSDVENGEPITPSPQYSEAAVNHTGPVVDGAAIENGLNNVDSHLAFLLNSLSKSALTTPADSDAVVKPEISHTPTPPVGPPSLPDPSSRVSSRALSPPHSSGHTARPSPAPSRSSSAQRITSPSGTSKSSTSSQATIQPSPTSPVSPRATRRPGLSADISPYFTRATAAAIPKQMKYLTMLENVAKESERMTPRLEKQIEVMNGLLPSLPPSNAHPGSFNPLPMAGPGIRDYPPFPHNFGPGATAANFPPGFVPHPPLHDPFTVRPRTSNAFHPVSYAPHYSRASMNEEQLRLMMAGVSPRAPLAHANGPAGPYPPTQQRMGYPMTHPSGAPPQVYPQPPLQQFGQSPLRVIPPQSFPSAPPNELGPLTAPPISPTFNLAPRPNAGHAHLLSILNTPSIPRPVTTVPSSTMGGHA
ncbi:pyrophosphatase DCP2 [Cristinia sonorae]|uniref:Pyrophosphatase DCP2 n=1 Tax=Cristinia sonorae TaxID=1940300 RepID=A0A8K0XQ39_9AGAR|nr:pyrophosphatase DCP2 [Cristinia sonorae]